MHVLLLSTYELGHQPLHLASAVAELDAAGHDVRALDLSVETLADADIDWADRVAVAVPMHTARRLAGEVASRIHERRPGLPVAFYGLYALVATDRARQHGVDAFLAGEYEDRLVEWVAEPVAGERVDLKQRRARIPVRAGLPGPEAYAALAIGGEHRPAGYLEASRGCRHRCRHCPLPTVYDGRYRVTGVDVVAADAAAQAATGVRHLTFGDPDFLNGPAHARKVLAAVAEAAPGVTMDVTVKVEHLLDHRELLGELADAGVVFVVSAFEHTDDRVLGILDKGHTVTDMAEAVALVRGAGMEIRPTWMPFTPWTERRHLVELVRFLDANDLWRVTDPIQLAIRLLLPDGSLLADHPAMTPHLRGYDPSALGHAWAHPDPSMDELAAHLLGIVEAGGEDRDVLTRLVGAIAEATGAELPDVPAFEPGPRLTEAWFCCAEPTTSQLAAVGPTSLP